MIKKFIAFTLAELMLVMGIIGVVAAIAIPAMRTDLDEQKTVAQLRKIAVDLQDSYTAMIQKYGEPYSWVTSSTTSAQFASMLTSRLAEFLNTSATTSNSITLKNGTYIDLSYFSSFDCSNILSAITYYDNKYYPHKIGEIYVDVNGLKNPPNDYGLDRFRFIISKNGIEPEGYNASSEGIMFSGTSEYNTAWVIKTGNMDYIRCADSLDWSTKRTCD